MGKKTHPLAYNVKSVRDKWDTITLLSPAILHLTGGSTSTCSLSPVEGVFLAFLGLSPLPSFLPALELPLGGPIWVLGLCSTPSLSCLVNNLKNHHQKEKEKPMFDSLLPVAKTHGWVVFASCFVPHLVPFIPGTLASSHHSPLMTFHHQSLLSLLSPSSLSDLWPHPPLDLWTLHEAQRDLATCLASCALVCFSIKWG